MAVAGDVGFTAKLAQYGLGYPPPDQVVIRQQHFDVERLGEGRDVLAARRRLHGGFGDGEEIGQGNSSCVRLTGLVMQAARPSSAARCAQRRQRASAA